MAAHGPYPPSDRARDAWILRLRPERVPLDPRRPVGWFREEEPDGDGGSVSILTVLLANRECPWRCVYCDLWRHTLERSVVPGDVVAQIDGALAGEQAAAEEARQIKLYNAGSFFDAGAIPPADDRAIAARCRRFERVIVESHPALVGDRAWRFRDLLAAGGTEPETRLEVAMGLETANPDVLQKLNKRVTLDDFAEAAAALRREGVALRAFVLVQPPFEDPAQAASWAVRSARFAFECGARVVSLIPVRPGNGALEALQEMGQFRPPELATLERALDAALELGQGLVLADTWDLERFSTCEACWPARRARLAGINESQRPAPRVRCGDCGSGAPNEAHAGRRGLTGDAGGSAG